LVDEELISLKNRVVYNEKVKETHDAFFTNFRKLEEINAWMNQLAQTSNGIATVINIGKSHEGREILGLKIQGKPFSNKFLTGKTPRNRPGILYHGGIHAREWSKKI
jgi:extracellular matrix protein 14